ncbi:DUF4265 domain-containing protein, partial [Streptomyces sp. NPDC005732]|uniref:DUF4265 domain-containing protein n=1 Tax=Streptomyces sp. NPDC005732 TaxID=3157057 RepID=UPI0034057BEC
PPDTETYVPPGHLSSDPQDPLSSVHTKGVISGLLWAGETVEPSQNCTIRLIVLKDDGSAAARQCVLEVFHRLGTTGEGIERFRMVALDIPPQADLLKIRELLEHGETKEWWHWEEGCVTAAWEATARP